MNISNAVLNIKIEDIVPNRFQPREHFADDGIEELAASIKEHGIIQPLVLRKLGDKFEIVAGERRYKAATLAGLTHVPAIISDIDDNKSAEVALVENIQRRNLSPIEEARSYKAILDKGNLTQEELATKMGISQSQVANKLRLLNLCDEVQEALLTQKISERHARTLLNVYDYDEQRKWLNRIIKERLTVRQLDMELKKEQGDTVNDIETDNVPLVNINPNLDDIKKNATDIIETKVEKNINDFLKPDENIAKIDEEAKPVVEEEKVEEKEEPLNTNRFFNFLEDEGPNMNMEEPINNTNPFMDNLNTPVSEPTTNVETPVNDSVPFDILSFDTLDTTPAAPVETPVAASVEEPFNFVTTPESTPVVEPTPVVTPTEPVNNINPFVDNNPAVTINPFLDATPVAPVETPVTPAEPMVNNTFVAETPVEPMNFGMPEVTPMPEVAPIVEPTPVEEPAPLPTANEIASMPGFINPMDSVNNINEPMIEETKSNNLNDVITEIRDLVKKLEGQGFVINLEELALPTGYQINININN